jgi:hypothetical protein
MRGQPPREVSQVRKALVESLRTWLRFASRWGQKPVPALRATWYMPPTPISLPPLHPDAPVTVARRPCLGAPRPPVGGPLGARPSLAPLEGPPPRSLPTRSSRLHVLAEGVGADPAGFARPRSVTGATVRPPLRSAPLRSALGPAKPDFGTSSVHFLPSFRTTVPSPVPIRIPRPLAPLDRPPLGGLGNFPRGCPPLGGAGRPARGALSPFRVRFPT